MNYPPPKMILQKYSNLLWRRDKKTLILPYDMRVLQIEVYNFLND